MGKQKGNLLEGSVNATWKAIYLRTLITFVSELITDRIFTPMNLLGKPETNIRVSETSFREEVIWCASEQGRDEIRSGLIQLVRGPVRSDHFKWQIHLVSKNLKSWIIWLVLMWSAHRSNVFLSKTHLLLLFKFKHTHEFVLCNIASLFAAKWLSCGRRSFNATTPLFHDASRHNRRPESNAGYEFRSAYSRRSPVTDEPSDRARSTRSR